MHLQTARDVFPARCKGLSDRDIDKLNYPGGVYYDCKRGVHASNYGGHPRTIATAIRRSLQDAERLQNYWFSKHPEILGWQKRVRDEVYSTRSVVNKFGFRIMYFDRVDDQMWRNALAWGPQSTVALVTDKGIVNVYRDLFPTIMPLGQVHDEGVYQVHRRDFVGALPDLRRSLQIEIPYDDTLIIPVGLKASFKSWGDCTPVDWDSPEEFLENERG